MEKNESAQALGRLSAQSRDTSSEAMRELVNKRWAKSTKKITIKDGWYWSAGRKYGWMSEYSSEGVGLNRDLFNSEKIIVTVLGKKGGEAKYELDSQKGLEFIKKYSAHTKIGGTKIGFIPRELMTYIDEEGNKGEAPNSDGEEVEGPRV